MEKLTYRELKEFVNLIDEHFLDFPVLIYSEESAVEVHCAEISNTEMVIFKNTDDDDDRYIETRQLFELTCRGMEPYFQELAKFPPGLPLMYDSIDNSLNDQLVIQKWPETRNSKPETPNC